MTLDFLARESRKTAVSKLYYEKEYSEAVLYGRQSITLALSVRLLHECYNLGLAKAIKLYK